MLFQKEILAHGTKVQLKKSTFVFVKFISESTPLKCSNDACRADLGRMPLKVTIHRQIIKCYNHLNSMSSNTIAKQALEISKSISTSKRKCFYSCYRNLIQKYNENRDTCAKSGLNKIYQKMKDDYYNFWKNRVAHSTKLEFFTSQKSIYSQERYLSAIKN